MKVSVEHIERLGQYASMWHCLSEPSLVSIIYKFDSLQALPTNRARMPDAGNGPVFTKESAIGSRMPSFFAKVSMCLAVTTFQTVT